LTHPRSCARAIKVARWPQTALLLLLIGRASPIHKMARIRARHHYTDRRRLPTQVPLFPWEVWFFEKGFLQTGTPGYQSFDCPELWHASELRERRNPSYNLTIINISCGAVTLGLRRLAHRLKQQLGSIHGFDVRSLCHRAPNGANAYQATVMIHSFNCRGRAGYRQTGRPQDVFFFSATQGAKRVALAKPHSCWTATEQARDAFLEYAELFASQQV